MRLFGAIYRLPCSLPIGLLMSRSHQQPFPRLFASISLNAASTLAPPVFVTSPTYFQTYAQPHATFQATHGEPPISIAPSLALLANAYQRV